MARPPVNLWRETVRFNDIARGPITRRLTPDASQLPAIAKTIGVDQLKSLTAEVTASPWLDGVELRGELEAEVVQTCGVTLEPLDDHIAGVFKIRLLPAGSPNLPSEDSEAELDLEADDPPDSVEGDEIDLTHYVVEHLALEVDPFPRKEGSVFEPPAEEEDASPFAVLKRLKQDDASN